MASNLIRGVNARLNQKTVLLNHIQSHLPVCLVSSRNVYGRTRIGNREVVGFGQNGAYTYGDMMDVPFPAIRFREETPEIAKLREKEKGDWKTLTIEDKKKLYRHSFCRTYAEMKASGTGEWKSILAGVCGVVSFALWIFILLKKFVYPPLPESTHPENKQRLLDFMIAWRVNPIEGVASKWDYEKNRWKD